jgi:hypothetical protein
MENAAHVESLQREVYKTPLTVNLVSELRDTPSNYRETYPGPGKVPDKINVWRVQNSPRGNVVARSRGFADSPDTEVIAVGFNHGKSYGDIGIGRQGNFLQWGYCDPPSQMTEAGRNLFLNCIQYIRRFDGKSPLVRVQNADRSSAASAAGIITRIVGDKKAFFLRQFPEELYEKYNADPEGLTKLYQANVEWTYREKVFRIDEELKSLDIPSNRKVETLDRLIALLDDAAKAATAKKLLARYTTVTFDTPQQWRQWFDANKGRIYFTDVGGYKFLVVPEGYLSR